ncbi:cysteine hydrolase family protein [Paenibacillus sp. RC84]|uniref:cysteine hydrolase family protein n=1 Tax=Paenibacillus sp. RC84 TaxID=3156252 RepID=UPI0035189ABF
MKKALVIIDMQEVFYTLPENHLYRKDELAGRINVLIDKARSASVPVVFIQHTSSDPGDEFYPGSPDWQLYHGMARCEDDTVIRKTTWDAFHETELPDFLQKQGVEQLVFAGAQTEFCLDTTLRSAYSHGYKCNLVVKDCHSTLDSSVLPASKIIEHHENIWNGRFASLQPMEAIAF